LISCLSVSANFAFDFIRVGFVGGFADIWANVGPSRLSSVRSRGSDNPHRCKQNYFEYLNKKLSFARLQSRLYINGWLGIQWSINQKMNSFYILKVDFSLKSVLFQFLNNRQPSLSNKWQTLYWKQSTVYKYATNYYCTEHEYHKLYT
jgi:hypothetical protein